MKSAEMYKKFGKFMTENKEYIKSNEEIWEENLKKLKEYIKSNRKRPSIIDKEEKIRQLGNWTKDQLRKYKKRINIMRKEEYYKKWGELEEEYKEYLEDSKETWYRKYKNLKRYIEENNKLPNKRDKEEKSRQLGLWDTKNMLLVT